MRGESFAPKEARKGSELDRVRVYMTIEPLLNELLRHNGEPEKEKTRIGACLNGMRLECTEEDLIGFVKEMLSKKIYEAVLKTRSGKGRVQEGINIAMKKFMGLLDEYKNVSRKQESGIKES